MVLVEIAVLRQYNHDRVWYRRRDHLSQPKLLDIKLVLRKVGEDLTLP
jgi:hypothetical protein